MKRNVWRSVRLRCTKASTTSTMAKKTQKLIAVKMKGAFESNAKNDVMVDHTCILATCL